MIGDRGRIAAVRYPRLPVSDNKGGKNGMDELKKRPLAVFCGGYLLSLLLGLLLFRKTAFFGLICLASAVLTAILFVVRVIVSRRNPHPYRRSARFLPLPALFLSFALGLSAAYLSAALHPRMLISLSDGETERTVTAIAGEKVWSASYGEYFYADLLSADGGKVKGKVFVRYQGGCGISPGDKLTMTGTLSAFETEENGFPEERYQLSKACFAAFDTAAVTLNGEEKGIASFFSSLADRLQRPFDARFERETASFLSAILFGRKDTMPDEAERNFRAIGGSHLFAVSGLHVGILLGGLAWILFRTGVPRWSRLLILTVSAVLFVGLTGFSYSAVRAAFMIWFAALGDQLGEDADSVTSLFLGCSLICVITPTAVLDIGLELSFSAALGILTVGGRMLEPLKERSYLIRATAAPVAVCLSALLFTIPVSWLYFGEISVLSPLTSLLSVLPVPAVLTAAALFPLFYRVPLIGALLADMAGGIARICLDGAAALAFPGALIPIRLPALIACGGTVILMLFLFRRKNGFFAILIPVISGFLVFGGVTAVLLAGAENVSSVSFFTDKKRDVLTVTDGKVTAMVDVTDGTYATARKALSETEKNIDFLILTHYHPAHISLCERIGGEQFLSALYLPYPETESERGIADRLSENGQNIRYYDPGKAIAVGGKTVTVSRFFLSRSVQPVVTVTVEGKGRRTVSVSGPLWEADPEAYRSLFAFDSVYFGSHGPSVKEPPDSYPENAVFPKE